MLRFKFDKDSVNKYAVAYQTKLSAGFDIRANSNHVLMPGEIGMISTGMYLDKSPWYVKILNLFGIVPELQLRPRSGLSLKGITLSNSPATIDQDFCNEIKVLLKNFGDDAFVVRQNDRIAQGIIGLTFRSPSVKVKKVERSGGLGSTGNRG